MKNERFMQVEQILRRAGFDFERKDFDRPWGGFWAVDQIKSREFLKSYFPEFQSIMNDAISISPKFLMVAPGARLSWQYHHRRSELWKVLNGPIGVIRSKTDAETNLISYQQGEIISLDRGERHRLVGLDGWGLVAEIWIHSDRENPSDEDDIVRLQDDFGRG